MGLSEKAQASAEMLLLVAAAVILATIVGLTLKNIIKAQAPEVETGTQRVVGEIGS